MASVLLSPLYIIVNAYIIWRLLKWCKACHEKLSGPFFNIFIISLYIFAALSVPIGFLLPNSNIQRFFIHLSNGWLGVLMMTILVIIPFELGRLILINGKIVPKEKLHTDKVHRLVGIACLLIIISLSIYCNYNAKDIKTTYYDIAVGKSAGELQQLKIVMLADLHIGYSIEADHVAKTVEKINAENADLVLIAGDIFDNSYAAINEPEKIAELLRGIRSKYGVYACYGNHDIEEKILVGFTFSQKDKKKESSPEMDEFLEKSNITLLRDEGLLIDESFYVYGRADYSRPGRGIETRLTPVEIAASIDTSKPVIMLDHQPRELDELAAANIDIDLGGHTHAGQLFPGTLLTKTLFENHCGYIKRGDMHNIVTSGVGIFGPYMRLGTHSEICSITVSFDTAKKH